MRAFAQQKGNFPPSPSLGRQGPQRFMANRPGMSVAVLELNCFTSEAARHVSFGFAAGCEALALPRRAQPDYCRAMPLVRA